MSKKFFDIIPPKRKNLEKEELSEKIFFHSQKKASYSVKKKEKKYFWGKLSRFIFILFILVIFFFFSVNSFFSKVEIEIKPETKQFDYNQNDRITIDLEIDKLDLSSKRMPGKILETEKTISEEFDATGQFFKKAEGVIRLYNKFTTKTEVWREGTRFVSSEGKLFLSKEKINVPGATLEGGKIVPSFVDVPVIAAQGGESYNIGPSKFSLAAFLGTQRYTNYYGESLEPMKGGGVVLQVTEEDLKKAKETLTDRIKKELNSTLQEEAKNDFVFLPQATKFSILKENSSAKDQEIVDKFTYEISANAANIVFSYKDINDLIFILLEKVMPEGYDFRKETLKIDYKNHNLDLRSGKMNFNLSFSISIYPKIELNSLKKSLAGKSLNESKILLERESSILKSKIKIYPFWIKRIPEDIEKVNIKLVFD